MASTEQRDTQERMSPVSDVHELLAADSITFIKGCLVAKNASGLLVMASSTAGLIAMGRCEENVVTGIGNTRKVKFKTGTFKWNNAGANPVIQSGVGETCWIHDNDTVRQADDTSSQAGVVVELDTDGVWVHTSHPNAIAAVVGT
jgi:hypothetical protein